MSSPTCETCRFFELFDHSEPRMVASNHPEEMIEKWRERFGDASAEKMRTSTHKNRLRQGSCRRYPPSIPSPDEEDVLHFPNVPYYEWCGEHEPIDEDDDNCEPLDDEGKELYARMAEVAGAVLAYEKGRKSEGW